MVVDITRHVVYQIHNIISVIQYYITLKWPRHINDVILYSVPVADVKWQLILFIETQLLIWAAKVYVCRVW